MHKVETQLFTHRCCLLSDLHPPLAGRHPGLPRPAYLQPQPRWSFHNAAPTAQEDLMRIRHEIIGTDPWLRHMEHASHTIVFRHDKEKTHNNERETAQKRINQSHDVNLIQYKCTCWLTWALTLYIQKIVCCGWRRNCRVVVL